MLNREPLEAQQPDVLEATMTESSPQYGPSPLAAAYREWWREQQRRQLVEPLWRDIDGYLLARLPHRQRVEAGNAG